MHDLHHAGSSLKRLTLKMGNSLLYSSKRVKYLCCFILLASYMVFFLPTNRTINILIWNPIERQREHWLGTGSDIFKTCEYKNCFLTDKKNYLPVEDFDAIIFNAAKRFNCPTIRKQDQIYIYENIEPPVETPYLNREVHKNFFNWTMTYRRDSDIYRPFGFIIKKENTNYKILAMEEYKKKNYDIAWFVSKCSTHSNRDILYSRITKQMVVHAYGNCTRHKCPKKYKDKCLKLVGYRYKFYFSFENSLCKDYVTYHLFDALQKDVIPIVYGGAKYEDMLPENSVINFFHYSSIDELVAHLISVGDNYKRYISYLQWKKHYVVNTDKTPILCDLCKKLNVKTKEISFYEDINLWWKGETNKKYCLNYNETLELFKHYKLSSNAFFNNDM